MNKSELIRKFLKTSENGNITFKTMGSSKSSSKREVYKNASVAQKTSLAT